MPKIIKKKHIEIRLRSYTLWIPLVICYIATYFFNGTSIVDLPIKILKDGDFPVRFFYVYQAG
jgi:hypothetical protein